MIKTLSFATFAAVAAMSYVTFADPGSPLLWFASVQPGVIAARAIVAVLIIIIALLSPENSAVRLVMGVVGGAMIFGGAIGFISSTFMRSAKPLDLIFAMESGIILCLTALNVAPEAKQSGQRVLGRYRFDNLGETPTKGRLLRRITRKA